MDIYGRAVIAPHQGKTTHNLMNRTKIFYIELKSHNPHYHLMRLKRYGKTLHQVQSRLLRTMPDEIKENYYISRVSEGINKPWKTVGRKKLDQTKQERLKIRRNLISLQKRLDKYRIAYGEDALGKFFHYLKTNMKDYRQYFTSNGELGLKAKDILNIK